MQYQQLIPVISNLFIIPLAIIMVCEWRFLYIEAFYTVGVVTTSFIYHLVRTTGTNLYAVSMTELQRLDHAFAEGLGGIAVGLYYYPVTTRKRHYIEIPLVSGLFASSYYTRTSWGLGVVLILGVVGSPFFHEHVRFRWSHYLLFVIIGGTAIFFYKLENDAGTWYPYTHGVWHMLSFCLLAFIVLYGRRCSVVAASPGVTPGIGINNSSYYNTDRSYQWKTILLMDHAMTRQ